MCRLLCALPVAEHDQLFKATFERRPEAASLLSRCLPSGVSAAIDWETLENLSPELCGTDLEHRQVDLLFHVKEGGRDARLLVLVEHQSRVDESMALRVHGYVTRIQERHRRDAPGEPVPLVLPVVVYQGTSPWNAPTRLSELMADVDPRLAAFVPNAQFLLIDLSRFTDEELRARALTPAATLTVVVLTQCRGVAQPERVLEAWFDQLVLVASGVDGVDVLTLLGTYVARASAGSPSELGVLFERLGETGKEAFVTMAEQMEQKWAAALVLRLLAKKFGSVPEEAKRRIASGSETELDRWAEQLLDAKSVAEALQ